HRTRTDRSERRGLRLVPVPETCRLQYQRSSRTGEVSWTALTGDGVHGHFSLASQLGETEIENLYLTALSDEDVGRLDVTMNDALGMRGFESLGELNADIEQTIKWQRRTEQLVIKALAFEQFHRNKGLPVRVFNRVDGTNIRVIQGRGGAGLEQKAIKRSGVAGHVRRKKLKRDTTT